MTDLEQKAADLEAAGWTVERPTFDDPYEVMFRKMQRLLLGDNDPHPEDDPMSAEFAYWDESTKSALAFLKKHFVLKSKDQPNG